ncbi:MAG: preprotein translocase subunit SecE [Omnitrophica WOR_2 bacterium GWA2_47_8]|nr:MAG: preprotein translocase subunit SecE [Omnitrophica WOR_2 bacterium GWA2_47_8]
MIDKIKKFIAEVAVELKKVSWTSRSELIDSTWVVIVSSLLLAVFIGVADFALSKILRLIIL